MTKLIRNALLLVCCSIAASGHADEPPKIEAGARVVYAAMTGPPKRGRANDLSSYVQVAEGYNASLICLAKEDTLRTSVVNAGKVARYGGPIYPLIVAFDRYDDWVRNNGFKKCYEEEVTKQNR